MLYTDIPFKRPFYDLFFHFACKPENLHILFSISTTSDNVDVIVFSVHEEYYKQCNDDPIGTYITPVPNFLQGYLQYYMQIQEDKGYDDYELPEVADYAYCTRVVIQNEEYWLQIGCSDGNGLSISVNIYEDNTCTTRSVVEGYDDANIDVSEIQVSYKLLTADC